MNLKSQANGFSARNSFSKSNATNQRLDENRQRKRYDLAVNTLATEVYNELKVTTKEVEIAEILSRKVMSNYDGQRQGRSAKGGIGTGKGYRYG